MSDFMGFEIIVAGKELSTHGTFQQTFSVGEKMGFEIGTLVEGTIADWTFVG